MADQSRSETEQDLKETEQGRESEQDRENRTARENKRVKVRCDNSNKGARIQDVVGFSLQLR